LDINRFAAFMALEVLICHHDGYALDRNNFRIYHDLGTDRMVFIPHGMDLIFDQPRLHLEGRWRGTVARAFMETQEGRHLYRQRVVELAKLAYGSNDLEKRLDELVRFIGEHSSDRTRMELDFSMAELRQALRERRQFILNETGRLSGN
jgi:spore coat protein CotH